jgi:hypothetical protein
MPHELNITAAQVAQGADIAEPAALALQAGRLCMTVESKKTGEHITVRATAKAKKGARWQRVPFAEATHVFCDVPGPEGAFPDKVGTYYPTGRYAGKFWSDREADPARVWCAQLILQIAAGEKAWENGQYAVLQDTYCLLCGRALTDPESIRRQIGPDCYGKVTGCQHQKKQTPQPGPAEQEALATRAGLPAGAEGSRHPFTQEELAEMNERSGAATAEDTPPPEYEEDPDAAYERYLENGGPHADRIQAEDAIEREAEANDLGLQEMRAGREAAEDENPPAQEAPEPAGALKRLAPGQTPAEALAASGGAK